MVLFGIESCVWLAREISSLFLLNKCEIFRCKRSRPSKPGHFANKYVVRAHTEREQRKKTWLGDNIKSHTHTRTVGYAAKRHSESVRQRGRNERCARNAKTDKNFRIG